MKKYFLVITVLFILFSCNPNREDKEHAAIDTSAIETRPDSAAATIDAHYFWSAEPGGKVGVELIKTRPITADSMDAPKIIDMLNGIYPEIQIQLIKISGDTLFLKIPKSTYLTQQMGSSGPEVYFAEVTYNLTELTGINYVDVKFKEGDHAAPQTFSRTDFVQEKK